MVQNTSIYNRIAQLWLKITIISLLAAIISFAPQAAAQSHISKATVGELIDGNPLRLDWKTSEVVIPFDLPDTVWIDKVEFLVSARPTGALRHNRNLHLRINGSDPIILKAQGQRFDARVKLDQKHLRRRGNKLYISGISTSSTCAGPNHEGWDISADRSLLVYYGRPMKRDLNLKNLVSMWDSSTPMPSLVGLKVIGGDRFRHESLIMQGLSIRANSVPLLKPAFSGNHIDVVAGLRDDIKPYIRNADHHNGSGAEIILDKGHPARLIITGDTAEQVTAGVNAFSSHKLPVTRRVKTTPHELLLQPVLSVERPIFDKTHRLTDAGPVTISNTWTTSPLNFAFDAPFSAGKTGKIVLRINGDDTLSESSSLQVSLNDRKLGETKIDARRKTVEFDITDGMLASSNNKLKIISDLQPASSLDSCDVADTRPGFSLGLGSKIVLKGHTDKNVHNVANLAVRTGPFASAKNVVIYSTAQKTQDRNSLLRLTGNIALISGKSWAHASYVEGRDPLISATDNLLILGPVTTTVEDLLNTAPKALKLALKGQKLPLIDEQRVAEAFKVASSESSDAIRLAAAAAASRPYSRSDLTGLMSLYDDPINGRTVGVISTKPGSSFSLAATNLLKPGMWDTVVGSVAAWNSSNSVMAQAPQSKLPSSHTFKSPSFDFNHFTSVNWDGLDIIHDDMFLALGNIWRDQASALNAKLSSWSVSVTRWVSSLYTANNAKPVPVELRTAPLTAQADVAVAANIPVPIVKPRNLFKVTENVSEHQAKTATPLKLRGTYKPKQQKFSFASINTPQFSMNVLQNNLNKTWKRLQSRTKSASNEFTAWAKTVNQTRVSEGQPPVIPSPLLALILIIFGGLIVLSIAGPKQLTYRGQV